MATEFKNELTKTLVDFLESIGLEIVPATIDIETFLPGILIENGKMLVDEEKLKYPGDLFHEAGHLAVAPSEIRSSLSGEVILPGVLMEPVEVQAMAWSYAAIIHLGLDPKIVFHDAGYKGAAKGLLENFNRGAYIGVNGLEDAGLTVTGPKATERGIPPYPHMVKWLRD